MKKEDRNFIDHLKSIHYKCREYLGSENYIDFCNYLNTFTEESDINELKMLLVISKTFREMEETKIAVSRIINIYHEVCKKKGIKSI